MHWNTSIRTALSPYAAQRDFERTSGLDSASSFGAMTVLESADRWTVEVDVPGALLADIDITQTDGSLVIEGHRKPRTEAGVKEVFNDRVFSKFCRELKVREGIDQSRIEADLRNGVLTLTLFRSAESSQHKITIRNANA
ncbi:MAG: Hsp20/alpha crystallin family protein [Planctomycetaceae bacterium]